MPSKYDDLLDRIKYKLKVYDICFADKTEEYKLFEESVAAIEELLRKEKFHAFLWNNLPKSILDEMREMYREENENAKS